MKDAKAYRIPFVGLSLGKHSFTYDVDSAFFQDYENSIVNSGKFDVRLELEKTETLLILNFEIEGHADVVCDRCADTFELPISIRERQIVKFVDKLEDGLDNEDDEIVYLTRNEYEIDISPVLYESINVSIPYTCVHPDLKNGASGCNPEVLKLLEKINVAEVEKDNRWSALEKLTKK